MAQKKNRLPPQFSRHLLGSLGLHRGLSTIYSLLMSAQSNPNPVHISRWENELSAHFSVNAWATAAAVPSSVSKCINHFELMRKIHLRWYLTPCKIAHCSSSASPLCWRQCSHKGTLLHMWWSCPCISPFWQIVFNLITELTGL